MDDNDDNDKQAQIQEKTGHSRTTHHKIFTPNLKGWILLYVNNNNNYNINGCQNNNLQEFWNAPLADVAMYPLVLTGSVRV